MAVMAHLILVFTSLIIVINLASATSINGGLLTSSTSNQREFDYFVFALQWPTTYCQRTKHCCESNACCRGSNAPTQFTIHGLWPNYNDGRWPSCCSQSEFDPKEISTLRDAIDKYWPTLSCGSSSTCDGHRGSFWAHEWGKHGTCASPVIRDEYEYFLTVINLYIKYNITEVLSEAGYVPSNSEKYPLGGIVSAIENAFHLSPSITCTNGAVKELHLCFYKDFKPRDCATNSIVKEVVDPMGLSRNSCPDYVSLPAYTSSGSKNGVAFKQMHHGSEIL